MDLKLIDNGNGGEISVNATGIDVIEGFENMPYLALFGGNYEEVTSTNRESGKQYFDWWGNSLLFAQSPSRQFNSLTERTLDNVALNSSGRYQIEQAALSDLSFMREFSEVSVDVSITQTDKVMIDISVQEPDNLQSKNFRYIWDATLKSLI